ncbi:hypothetical protein KUTeg_024482 [Tegillarca granosa]|uniref:Vps72/YL1 C-terminal domain-containing protein n=1 Tax=Tegillarca granosa TaxID=220873 RepID=A0ABQ9DXH1_TEGGR|nr:hypothetical protein KUTeg_024482 [Tegillarca granosa]
MSSRSKRPAKGKTSPAATPSKRKRPGTPASSGTSAAGEGNESEVREESPVPTGTPVSESTDVKIPVFKDPNFVHSSKEAASNKRTRVWKNLKQIVAAERSLPWKPNDANYRDPETKLRYATSEEYSRIKLMPSDLVMGCLALRKANPPVP